MKILCVLTVFAVCLFSANSVFAENGKVYIVPKLEGSQTAQVGVEFLAEVAIDKQTAINAFDFIIDYSKDKARFLGVDKTNSIADIWTNYYSNSPGQIFLSGAILKSFSGKGGLIAGLHFKAISPGILSISFAQSDVYAADGLGTKIKIESAPILLSITANNTTPTQTFKNDNFSAPAILDFQIIKNLADGSSLASFLLQNASSSDTAEMRIKKWFFWGDWRPVQNPALLPRDAWAVELKVSNSSGHSDKIIYDYGIIVRKLILLFSLALALLLLIGAGAKVYNKRIKKVKA